MDISVILIEFHSLEDVKICVQSFMPNLAGLEFEIIVSSNSCYSAEIQEQIKADEPHVAWIFNDRNVGFAQGVNKGIEQACGKSILVSNVDVEVFTPLAHAYHFLMNDDSVGLIGPQIVDGKGRIQDSCRTFMSPLHCLTRFIKRVWYKKNVLLEPAFDYDMPQSVDWVIGAFMLVKRSAMKRVGMMDEDYFMYVEDMDWCKRFWAQKFKVVYYPSLKIKYEGDRKSTSPFSKKKVLSKYTWFHFISYVRFLVKFGIAPKR